MSGIIKAIGGIFGVGASGPSGGERRAQRLAHQGALNESQELKAEKQAAGAASRGRKSGRRLLTYAGTDRRGVSRAVGGGAAS